ncbi:junctional sarcoplasmic reticulum protein 1 [Ursus americanus]|uniref:junctional sarcoplasmic reticulum protein 1 n=1 Tax=Ursus americanus TaxID=9643 RepID=UPI001E67DDB6|nr:junctional sarcoplasmic reticulum protein 1 [Ursus americanus]
MKPLGKNKSQQLATKQRLERKGPARGGLRLTLVPRAIPGCSGIGDTVGFTAAEPGSDFVLHRPADNSREKASGGGVPLWPRPSPAARVGPRQPQPPAALLPSRHRSLQSGLAHVAASSHLLLSVLGPPSLGSICPAGSPWWPWTLPLPKPDRRGSDVSMTTRALQELDGGLGSSQAGEDLSTLADPCPDQPQEDRAQAMPRLADSSSWPHVSQAEGSPAGSVDARPKKTEKEPVAKVAPAPGKERLKAGATPRSPARRKVQASPPPQRPPPPPAPALSEELPWGDLSLNKCLVLASLVALLGSAFQLCRDAVAGEADAPASVPEPWVPPSSAPEPALAPPKPKAWAPPPGPPAPQREEAEEAEKAVGEKRAPKEPPRKERPRKEKPPKEERLQKEKRRKEERPRKQEKPRAAREPRGALPRGWEVREGGHPHWAQDSRDPGHRKRQAWDSPRRADADRPPGRQKHRAGKGRD